MDVKKENIFGLCSMDCGTSITEWRRTGLWKPKMPCSLTCTRTARAWSSTWIKLDFTAWPTKGFRSISLEFDNWHGEGSKKRSVIHWWRITCQVTRPPVSYGPPLTGCVLMHWQSQCVRDHLYRLWMEARLIWPQQKNIGVKMRMISSRGSIQSSIHVMAVSLIPRPPDLVAQACGQNQMHAVAHSILQLATSFHNMSKYHATVCHWAMLHGARQTMMVALHSEGLRISINRTYKIATSSGHVCFSRVSLLYQVYVDVNMLSDYPTSVDYLMPGRNMRSSQPLGSPLLRSHWTSSATWHRRYRPACPRSCVMSHFGPVLPCRIS